MDYEEGIGTDQPSGVGLWSSTSLSSEYAYRAWEWSNISFSNRFQGFSIRPVRDKATEVNKCAKPIISYIDGKLRLSCATEGVKFKYDISITDDKKNEGTEVLLSVNLKISVFATKEGYKDSDALTAEINIGNLGTKGDVNNDGKIDIVDVTTLIDKILQK